MPAHKRCDLNLITVCTIGFFPLCVQCKHVYVSRFGNKILLNLISKWMGARKFRIDTTVFLPDGFLSLPLYLTSRKVWLFVHCFKWNEIAHIKPFIYRFFTFLSRLLIFQWWKCDHEMLHLPMMFANGINSIILLKTIGNILRINKMSSMYWWILEHV